MKNSIKTFIVNNKTILRNIALIAVLVVSGLMIYGSILLAETTIDLGVSYISDGEYTASAIDYIAFALVTFGCVALHAMYKAEKFKNVFTLSFLVIGNCSVTAVFTIGALVWLGLSNPMYIYPITALYCGVSTVLFFRQQSLEEAYNGRSLQGFRILGSKIKG